MGGRRSSGGTGKRNLRTAGNPGWAGASQGRARLTGDVRVRVHETLHTMVSIRGARRGAADDPVSVTLMAVQTMMDVASRRGARLGLLMACWLVAHRLMVSWGAGFRRTANWVAVRRRNLKGVCGGGKRV